MNTDLNLASRLPTTVGLSERRPLTKGQRGRRVTHFPSRKNQMAIGCAYLQHVEFCVLLEFDQRIIRYSSRPCALEFKDFSRRYCPDFCAVFNDNRIVFYEISKPVRIVSVHEERRLAHLRQQFGVAGILFERVTLAQLAPAEKNS